MASEIRTDLIKDKSNTKTLATLSSSAITLHSDVTIADGASPHGWEHIKTIAYSADTATNASGTTATKMSNVVSSKYSAYKLIIQWGSVTSGKDLNLRFLDTSDAVVTGSNYHYGYQIISHTGVEGANIHSGSDNKAQIGNDIVQGSAGFNAEMLFYNCFNGQSNFPQIDGHQLTYDGRSSPYKPHVLYRQTGYDSGSYYAMGTGFVDYDINLYVSGFCLYFESDSNVQKDSFWSCYGLKLPTAD